MIKPGSEVSEKAGEAHCMITFAAGSNTAAGFNRSAIRVACRFITRVDHV